MPVFKSGKGLAPAWCEMEVFEIVDLARGAAHTFERAAQKEKLIVGKGRCRVAYSGQVMKADRGTELDVTGQGAPIEFLEALSDTTLIRMCGHWGDETGGSGLFSIAKSEDPHDAGDPVGYAKETDFDNHYHDCDEYWILFKGRGFVVSEGERYEVGPGDCVATGMGHHHDFPQVSEMVEGVYFETTLEGRKRLGHLWNHTHGTAHPLEDRI